MCTSNTKQNKNDLTYKKLKGKVRTVKTTEYRVTEKFGEIIKDENASMQYIEIFTVNGNIEQKQWFGNGRLERVYNYIYDDIGNNIVIETINESDSSLMSKTINKFNDDKYKIEENNYNAEGVLTYKSLYLYDDEGNIIEENYFDINGLLIEKTTYSYENLNRIREERYNSNGEFISKTEYRYNDKNELIEIIKPNNPIFDLNFTYELHDEHNNWLKKIRYDAHSNHPAYLSEREITYY